MNMSYCRYRNTLLDLQDCYDEMNSPEEGEYETYSSKGFQEYLESLDIEERNALKDIIELAQTISEEFGTLLEEEKGELV